MHKIVIACCCLLLIPTQRAWSQATRQDSVVIQMRDLSVGNYWEYSISTTTTGSHSTRAPRPILIQEITHSEIREDKDIRFYRSREFDLDGSLINESICSFEYVKDTPIFQRISLSLEFCDDVDQECRCQDGYALSSVDPESPHVQIRLDQNRTIGGTQYSLPATSTYSFSGYGGAGSGGGSHAIHATGIGVVQFGSYSESMFGSNSYTATLSFARVQNNIYGTQILNLKVGREDVSIPNFKLNSPFPNPTQDHTRLELTLSTPGNVVAVVYSIEGKEVLKTEMSNLNPGSYDLDLNLSSLKSGLYMIRVTSSVGQQTRKIIVL